MLQNAAQHLRDTNHAIATFLAHARPGPLTTNELGREE